MCIRDSGMGTNPIQMMQALSAQVIRHKRVMKDNCVIICSSICNGYFHDERWPYLRELYEMFQHDHMNILPDMDRYGEYFATNQEYIRKYRFATEFHPLHGFSKISCVGGSTADDGGTEISHKLKLSFCITG